MNNNGSTLNTDNSNLKVAVNSVQRTLFVERLSVNPYATISMDYVVPYDYDNLYPNKIKSIAQRSGTVMSAAGTLAAFICGDGFVGMDTVVNRFGQTWWDILRFVGSEKSIFDGCGLHFNYNQFGQIAEINPVNFDFIRWSKNLTTYYVNPDWAKRKTMVKHEIEYTPFNPAAALSEMKAQGGYEKYKGQLLYWIPQGADYYTVSRFDSVLDDAQFEAEAKLYSLSNIQNDYSLSGIIAYPKNMTDKEEIEAVKAEVGKDKGAAQAGGVRVVGAIPTEGLTGWKWFTPMSRNNIDTLHKNQVETAKFNIYAAYRQPAILNGVESGGMFNEASFADAFHYYNAATETERKDVEKLFNKILPFTIWSGMGTIQIQPKKFVTRSEKTQTPSQ